MRLLITGGNSRFARSLTTALSQEHAVRLLDTQFADPVPERVELHPGDLREPSVVTIAMAGVEAVLHLDPLSLSYASDTDEITALDRATRGSYVLMNAAREAKVGRVILGSSLDLFDRLPAHWRVNEVWRPRPEPRLDQLCAWLAELSVRESARVGDMSEMPSRQMPLGYGVQVICLRFGRLVDDAEAGAQTYDPRWLHVEDALLGMRQALDLDTTHLKRPDWAVFHITAPGPRAKIRLAH
jgi:nucleoside-diphosphate-sugar epimerase